MTWTFNFTTKQPTENGRFYNFLHQIWNIFPTLSEHDDQSSEELLPRMFADLIEINYFSGFFCLGFPEVIYCHYSGDERHDAFITENLMDSGKSCKSSKYVSIVWQTSVSAKSSNFKHLHSLVQKFTTGLVAPVLPSAAHAQTMRMFWKIE